MTNQENRSFSVRTKSRGLNVLALALIAVSPVLSSCKAPPRSDLLVAEKRPDQVTDPISYQKDMACIANDVRDKGPTPAIQIDHILPGRLTIGLKTDEISSKTEWAVKQSYTLDGAQWHYLEPKTKPSHLGKVIGARAIDLDLNGTIDWIRVQAGSEDSKRLLSRSKGLTGGRTSISSYRVREGCSYDRRVVYSSNAKPYTDADLGEAAYCAARMKCSISEVALCSKPLSSPVLIVEQHDSYASMTLQGHGSFKPAHSTAFVPHPNTPACHSFASNRGYL